MKKLSLLAFILLASLIYTSPLSTQITVDAASPVFKIYLFRESYGKINVKKFDPGTKNQLFGRDFEINLENETLHLTTDGMSKKLRNDISVAYNNPHLRLKLTNRWRTILVIEGVLDGSADNQKYRTMYGLVPIISNGKTEYKYCIIEPRTRIR